MNIGWELLRATLIFPLNNFVIAPALLLWWTRGSFTEWLVFGLDDLVPWLGLVVFAAGVALMLWTVALFASIGGGTPNPAEPPTALVIRGPYHYCRNPMMVGAVIALVGEALFFASWILAAWTFVYAVIYGSYGLLFEERGLERRFGRAYADYKRNVPRWLPRLTPWQPGQG